MIPGHLRDMMRSPMRADMGIRHKSLQSYEVAGQVGQIHGVDESSTEQKREGKTSISTEQKKPTITQQYAMVIADEHEDDGKCRRTVIDLT